MRCVDCKFSTWVNRTPTGRVMKNMPGKCGWSKIVRVAPGCNFERSTILHLKGGKIWPDDTPDCQVGMRKT